MASKRNLAKDKRYALLREFKGTQMEFASLEPLGAHSTGIGRKIVNGKSTDTLALRVYVSKKLPKKHLSPAAMVPKKIRHFSRISAKNIELETDVIEVPPAQFEAIDPTDRFRPAQGGVSLGIPSVTAGTLGGWVWDMTDDTIVMLSNDHVIGDSAGVSIMQPGVADGGSLPTDRIGETKRRIVRSATVPNDVDCAIGNPDDSAVYDLRVEEIGPAVYATDFAALDMLVEKFGRTTKHTFGEVQDVDWSGTVSGRPFEDCMFVDIVAPSTDWSAGGDSGSLVFSQQTIEEDSDIKPAVGLHFAGPQFGTYGLACKVQNVFTRLNLTNLCSGAFAAFIEALFETEEEGALSLESETRLRTLSALATGSALNIKPFMTVARDNQLATARRFHSGIARDVQTRLRESKRGRLITQFVDRNRAALLNALTQDRDIQRATIKALRPLVAGATITTDVLNRAITEEDLERLQTLAKEIVRKGDRKMKAAVKPLQALSSRASGKSLAKILQIKV